MQILEGRNETTSPIEVAAVGRFITWLTLFNTWVLFEETVIDRYGLWRYLPYYRVGKLCAWDLGAMALLAYGVWWLFRRARVNRSRR